MSYWKSFTRWLENACEYVENKFTECVGEETSKAIGDFFLFSFLVSRPKNKKNNDSSVDNSCVLSLDRKNGKYQKLDIVDNDVNLNPCCVSNENL